MRKYLETIPYLSSKYLRMGEQSDVAMQCAVWRKFSSFGGYTFGPSALLFVLGIPKHRIVSVRYKDRIVWDKSTCLDYI